MKVAGIHHIAIAVKDLEKALAFFRDLLGAKVIREDVSEAEKRKAVFLSLGPVCLEIMQPLSSEGELASFIEKRGEGIHSLGLKVESFEGAVRELERAGARVVGQQITPFPYAFTHPKDSFGVMLEISEYRGEKEEN